MELKKVFDEMDARDELEVGVTEPSPVSEITDEDIDALFSE